MRRLSFFLVCSIVHQFSVAQVGGRCEGCEAIHEYGDQVLSPVDTLPEFSTHENKMLITGTVFQKDGITPASDIIIYAYHTNEEGIYPKKGNEIDWARRHGYLRGWVKTNSDGKFYFYSFKPQAYPSRTEAAHVHLTIKEPDKNEYYIDVIEFDDDPLLTTSKRNRKQNRGGSGIVKLGALENGILLCKRDIVLGKNIPNYPLN